jgi:type IV pilus assembly protein PilW
MIFRKTNAITCQRGVTLIELMVALLIGGMLIAGTVTVYMQSRNTYRTTDTAARLQETGRYAFGIIEPDVREASFWGLTNQPIDVDYKTSRARSTDPQMAVDAAMGNNCGKNWVVDVEHFVDGLDNGTFGLKCSSTSPAAWSDVLIVRRAGLQVLAAPVKDLLQIQSHRIDAQMFIGTTIPSGFAAAPASETHAMIVNAYYVSAPPPGPSGIQEYELRREKLIAGPTVSDESVIPDVQDLQVQFGIDTDNDGNANVWVNPPIVLPPPTSGLTARAVSARIWLLVVSEQPEVGFTDSRTYKIGNHTLGPFNDGRRRLLISKTIQIRNSQPTPG